MNYLYPVADIAKPSVDAGEMITSAKELGIHTSSTVLFVLFFLQFLSGGTSIVKSTVLSVHTDTLDSISKSSVCKCIYDIKCPRYKYKWNAETTISMHMEHALFSVLLRAHFSAALHIR